MKSIFYEWIKYELPSLSPQTDYDYLNFSRQKTNETIPRKWRYKKKTMKLIISPFWLFYRHGYIKQMNWNTFKMTKKVVDFIYLISKLIIIRTYGLSSDNLVYIYSYLGAISIRLLILNNVSTLWNFIMGLAFSEVALNMQFQ